LSDQALAGSAVTRRRPEVKVVLADPAVTRFRSHLGELSGIDLVTVAVDDPAFDTHLADADAFVGAQLPVSAAPSFQGLGLVQVPGAGIDGIPVTHLPSGTVLANVFEHEHSIGEYVIMAMLAMSRDLVNSDRDLRHGVWRNPALNDELPFPLTLRGRQLLLVGFGHIGQVVARFAQVFGMRVSAVRRSPELGAEGIEGVDVVGVDQLQDRLGSADFVVVVVPLTDETRGLIAEAELAAMKEGAGLVNVARGPVVDENDLFDALESRRLASAALDVWYHPPGPEGHAQPATRPFHQLRNVLMTPHYSGVTEETFRRRTKLIGDNLRWFRDGQALRNVVMTC
jgi:phosphoglycerate dehydrogenase-like enzyme